ncbi:MAG: SDR family oxidoreductase [Chloroflexi bacterium]|nr:SDR family oxidoreductase [Chloroflexota bacterium]
MELGLQGRVALVAAASKGLGKAVAVGLAREGARVSIFSRHEQLIATAADEIRTATGAEVLAQAADVTSEDDLQRVVRTTLDRFGRIDILFNNAGGPPPGLFEEFDDAAWQQAYELNLLSVVRLTRLALPSMQRSGWGRIINSTSIAVRQPIPGLILSNSIRSAVVGLAKTLSDEVARHGITVNNLAPGRIHTERIDELDQARAARQRRSLEGVRQEAERSIPMGRYGRPEEYAAAAVFLASEQASYITGVTLVVDGGLVRASL